MNPLVAVALLPLVLDPTPACAASTGPVALHAPHVLGCSLDLLVNTGDTSCAEAVREVVLTTFDTVRRALDTRDPRSSASAYGRGAVPDDPVLKAVLGAYSFWETHTGGAVSSHTGDLAALWKKASVAGVAPSPAALENARCAGLDLDALGKAFALEIAAGAVSRAFPNLAGFLINVGGDIVTRGVDESGLPWSVGVASSSDSAYNAAAVDTLRVTGGAVVTSGDAHRRFSVAGAGLSHVLDPRTGLPSSGARGATVVAPDAVTANALSCAICVLGEDEGLALVERTPGAAARVETRTGGVVHSLRWSGRAAAHLCAKGTPPPAEASVVAAWPDKMRFLMTLNLQKVAKRNPYVAVWITDASGRVVRNLVVWGTKPKYFKELKQWWGSAVAGDATRAAALSKATHKPGRYELEWDGRDEAGAAVAFGEYTVNIELSQENVGHYTTSGKISCKGSTSASVTLKSCGKALDPVSVRFASKP